MSSILLCLLSPFLASADHPSLLPSVGVSGASGCLQLAHLHHGEESAGVSLTHTHTHTNTGCSPSQASTHRGLLVIDFSHLAPLFDNPKLDRELRSMLRERFPEFCSSPSPPTEGNTHRDPVRVYLNCRILSGG